MRNVLVDLPQPPFGDTVATMFVRDTPGRRRRLVSKSCASSLSPAVTKSARMMSRRRVSGVFGAGLPSTIGVS
jgi:hypothetical protein